MSPKILSVDDSKAVRMSLSRLFSRFACELFEAVNGQQGLQVAARERPDLIILDYNMPVMNGVGMLQRLRENAELRRIPVIMLTTESSAENIATVARLGVRDYVTKPFNEELLLAKAARVVSLVAREPSIGADNANNLVSTEGQKRTKERVGETSSSSAAALQRASVLVVDDSRTMRLSMIRALKDLGFDNIQEAKN